MYNSLLFCEFQLERENFSKNVFFQVSLEESYDIFVFFFQQNLNFIQCSHCYYVHVALGILVLPKSLSMVTLQ